MFRITHISKKLFIIDILSGYLTCVLVEPTQIRVACLSGMQPYQFGVNNN